MTRHTVNGAFFSINYSEPTSSCAPVETLTGAHMGIWVFDIRYAVIALPPPWGDFEQHMPMSGESDGPLSRARLALVARWSDGYLAGPGVGRLYFEPPPDPDIEPQAGEQADLLAQLDQTLSPGVQLRAPLGLKLQQFQQQTLLEYIFRGLAGGPLGAFNSIDTWLPSRYAPIRIRASHEHLPAPDTERPPSAAGRVVDEVEQVTIEVGASDKLCGRLVLRPRRAANYKPVRLFNSDPPLRDDISLAEDAGSHWADPEAKLETAGGQGTAEMSDINWYWDATTGATLAALGATPRATPVGTPSAAPPPTEYQELSED